MLRNVGGSLNIFSQDDQMIKYMAFGPLTSTFFVEFYRTDVSHVSPTHHIINIWGQLTKFLGWKNINSHFSIFPKADGHAKAI